MVKLVCPNCMQTVAVPDDAAGKDASCPGCGTVFAVPARYNPVVAAAGPPLASGPSSPAPHSVPSERVPMSSVPTDRPPPPPGLVPPAYPPPGTQLEPRLPPEPPVPSAPAGYTRSFALSLSPRVLAWIPAVCLSAIFILSFFPWVGSYVGGTSVYSQTAWRAAFGGQQSRVWQNVALADLMKRTAGWPGDVLDRTPSDWLLLLPYLLAVFVAVLIAWAERMMADLDRTRLPPRLRWASGAWPYRIPIVAGLATLALLLLLIQLSRGFGLERAFEQTVSERFAAERQANASSPQAQAAIDYKEKEELARYKLEHTTWLYLALILNILVVLAMVARSWLDRRGNKPPPRIVVQY